jgi:hypothetical protein
MNEHVTLMHPDERNPLWHIAKCAEPRERARRLIEFGIRG